MKTALLIASAVGLALVNLEPVRAASFEFQLDGFDSFSSYFYSEGELSFDDSPLTGRGIETVELSELENANFRFSFNVPSPEDAQEALGSVLSLDNEDNPTLEFNNGELSGIFLELPPINVLERVSPYRASYALQELEYTLDTFFLGDKFQQFIFGKRTYFYYDDPIVTGINGVSPDDLDGGNGLYIETDIIFTTIEAVTPTSEPPTTAVPEPSLIFGISLAMGCGISLKRQKKNV